MKEGEYSGRPMTVSVIMATYNREKYIGEALDSIFKQTRPPDEVIVVDDGSTDCTSQVIATFGDKVQYIHKSNGGRSSALNVGLANAKGSHVWIFDDDDVALPTAIESGLRALETQPDAYFSYSYKLFYDGDGDIWNRSRWRKHRIQTSDPDRLFVELMRWCFLQSQGMLIAKVCFEAVGPFDEKLLRGQDYEMLLRITRRFKGAETRDFTYVLRNHSGVRGSASERHRNADRMRVWREYDKPTFVRLRKEVMLHEYLPGKSYAVLSESNIGVALLIRADIMYQHGLYKEGSLDLVEAVAAGVSDTEVSTMMRHVTNVGQPAFVPGLSHIPRALRRLIHHKQGGQWNTNALRGCYWTLRRMTSRRQWLSCAIVFYTVFLLGVNEICRQFHALSGRRVGAAR